jgi:hypothetical protein
VSVTGVPGSTDISTPSCSPPASEVATEIGDSTVTVSVVQTLVLF